MRNNLFDISNLSTDKEQFDVLLERGKVRLERIVSFGKSTPEGEFYDQLETEWVTLLKGTATLSYGDGMKLYMEAGDTALIKPHVIHRVDEVSDDAIWLALFIE